MRRRGVSPGVAPWATSRVCRRLDVVLASASVLAIACPVFAMSPRTITGPAGSARFGQSVAVLANGNIVVTDPLFDLPDGTPDVGAAYLYRPDGTLVSVVTGSRPQDLIGFCGIKKLSSGHYLICSALWDSATGTDVGAVTFGHAGKGIGGVVGSHNSIIGATSYDFVGRIVGLANGNYLVASPNWDSGAVPDAGAVTFGRGDTGSSGVVSPANSLIGSTAADRVGSGVVVSLSNGNYVVATPAWDHGAVADAGAVTLGDGANGTAGSVTSMNSLVGTTAGDQVGERTIVNLASGNYVVQSPRWDNGLIADAGAVTFCRGNTALTGPVGPGNSLVGSHPGDLVGSSGVAPLTNGNYVVRSPNWGNGTVLLVGAATWGNGLTGVSGLVGPDNSLVGSTFGDQVSLNGVAPLANGNYTVSSQFWDRGAVANAGAVTFGSGTAGVAGVVGAANSLVGMRTNDSVAFAKPLANGNFAVLVPSWDSSTAADVGAVVLGDGESGTFGIVGNANALTGSTLGDNVGSTVTALTNGNFLVHSPHWDSGSISDAGAVTLVSGSSGLLGAVGPSNSLVGSSPFDSVGASGALPLANGNFVVSAPHWDNGGSADAGAITIGDGHVGLQGPISLANSLVGASAGDKLGSGGLLGLPNSDFVIGSPEWTRSGVAAAGATTYVSGKSPLPGTITPDNSIVGSMPGDRVGAAIMPIPNDRYAVVVRAKDLSTPSGAITDAGALVPGGGSGDITAVNASLGRSPGSGSSFTVDASDSVVAVGKPADNEVDVFAPATTRPDGLFSDGFERVGVAGRESSP